MDAVVAELDRVEEAAQTVVADLERSESELDAAEAAHRQAEDDRHRVEEERRRIGEEAASRRAEADAVRGTLASAEHEHQRLGGALDAIRARVETAEAARGEIEADIEHLDGQTAPLAERRRQLDDERRALVDRIEQLTEARVRMQARKDLLDARRRDIEETPGSRFLAEHGGRAVGLLKDLVRIEDGLKRALVAALGPLADAVVYDDGALALADAPNGDGAILAIAAGGPVPVGLPGERQLLAAVDAEPAVRGIVSTVLRDVYLAATVDDAARKQAAHPDASFVTPEGVLVGPAVIHTAREADVRLREIRAELQVLAHDLSATDQQLRPRTERLEEIGGEVTFLQEQIEAADAEITDAAGRSTAAEHELVAMRTEADLLAQRFAAVTEAATAARDRLAAMGPTAGVAIPDLPPLPQAPIQLRVSVETLRRERVTLDHRAHELRAERDQLAAHDPVRLREDLAGAETARLSAEAAVAAADEAFAAATATREATAVAEREAAEREAAINKSWRDASTALDDLRLRYEDEDRLRGDIERRITEAERLLREGFQADPDELVATLTEDDSVETIEKRQELVQRRLAPARQGEPARDRRARVAPGAPRLHAA